MSVVAKFRVNEIVNRAPIVEYEGRDGETKHGAVQTFEQSGGETIRQGNASVKLGAVYVTEGVPGASAEDISFSLATPSGQIEMSITNPDALEEFQPGDEFYVRFEKVE